MSAITRRRLFALAAAAPVAAVLPSPPALAAAGDFLRAGFGLPLKPYSVGRVFFPRVGDVGYSRGRRWVVTDVLRGDEPSPMERSNMADHDNIPYWLPNDQPRDRGFGPAVQAAVERAANASTDPRWKPEEGGLPIGWRSDTCAAGAPGIAGTITPPTAEPLSPFLRAELERIARDMDAAREALRQILERP